jgi:Holliday junction resolvase RusA-like endonuclease
MTSYADAPFHCPPDVVIALPLGPSSNNMFVNRGHGRFRSAEYVAWVKEAGWTLAAQKPPKVFGRVSLTIDVAEPKTKRAMDLANREKAVTDLLVAHRIIQGDDQRYVRELHMRWRADISGVIVNIRACE